MADTKGGGGGGMPPPLFEKGGMSGAGTPVDKTMEDEKKRWINKSLVSLKAVMFLFFAGLGCIVPFLPLHMPAIGLTMTESKIVTVAAAFFSALGPLIAGPVADRLTARRGTNSGGKHLRTMAAIAMILGALFYCLLMAVPTVDRIEARRPSVRFNCDQHGAIILQERCTEEKTCYHWKSDKVGSLLLSNCRYACDRADSKPRAVAPLAQSALKNPTQNNNPVVSPPPLSSGEYESDYYDSEEDEASPEAETERRRKRQNRFPHPEPPHLCHTPDKNSADKSKSTCQVYTRDTKQLKVQVTLQGATNKDDSNSETMAVGDEKDHAEEWCRYPVGDYFRCRIPPRSQLQYSYPDMFSSGNSTHRGEDCSNLVVECGVDDPYDAEGSVMADSQCMHVFGDPVLTFWLYLVLRCLADCCPLAAVALLGAAAVIATRETSAGRGDVGRQLAWGALGWGAAVPLVGWLQQEQLPPDVPAFVLPISVHAGFMLVAALVLLCASGMPLSPPEWWWHTKSGMLALPMSAVRKYGPETAALCLVLALLGTAWSALDTYQPWHLASLNAPYLLQGLALTVGALPSVPLLWFAEPLADHCGHANLLMAAFAVHALRYLGLSAIEDNPPWTALALEALEPLSLGLSWAVAMMYMRHLVPRRLTATGQALPVAAHFALGRGLGALIGALVIQGRSVPRTLDSVRTLYCAMAVACCVVAALYFLLYHFLLAPKCAARSQAPPSPEAMRAMNITGGGNGNGSYTPLRVYHNGRGRKGHFRY